MNKLFRMKLIGLAALACASAAHAQTLGASFQQVSAQYNTSQEVQVDGAPALELRDVDYAGLKWSRVDFVFDSQRHLSRMEMTTEAASYDAVIELASRQLDETSAPATALADAPVSRLQIRVCEDETGAVKVTYEPLSTQT